MPEGDAVARLARTFEDVMQGERVGVTSPQGRFSSSAARIDGWDLVAVRAHGKHMFLGFAPHDDEPPSARTPSAPGAPARRTPPADEGGHALVDKGEGTGAQLWIHVHLGLYGAWRFSGDETFAAPASIGAPRVVAQEKGHRAQTWTVRQAGADTGWEPPDPVGQVRLRLRSAHGVADLTGPTRCELVDGQGLDAIEARLGPDPLAPGARTDTGARDRFVAAVRGSRRVVGELVMDQSVVAGVGNIYRAESLFLAGISPLRRGEKVSELRLRHLWVVICDLMARGLELGRIDTVAPSEAPDPPIPGDEEASRWYVYHRTGRPCLRCGTPIAEKLLQQRRLFWCPGCQH